MRTRTYDPFGWRLAELADPDINPVRRAELLDDLVAAEAEELAMGRRHLTIVHGEPTDIATAEALSELYAEIESIARTADWSRLAGGTGYLTVTLTGLDRDELLSRVAALLHPDSRGCSAIGPSPLPI